MPTRDPKKRKEHLSKYNNSSERKLKLKIRALRVRHGLTLDEYNQLWREQEGCCYLCERSLDDKLSSIDHSHKCCPTGFSCYKCRRGIACRMCNAVLGHFKDDHELLQIVCNNLKIANSRIKL